MVLLYLKPPVSLAGRTLAASPCDVGRMGLRDGNHLATAFGLIGEGLQEMILDYVALVILIFLVLVFVYGIIAIHDIPYEIARKRNHPHQDAIMAAGWVSLFTLHAIWPFLWIWAMAYRPDHGWGGGDTQLAARVAEVERRLDRKETAA